jgi:hypothetical protein
MPQLPTIDELRFAKSEERADHALLFRWPESLYAFDQVWRRLAEHAHLRRDDCSRRRRVLPGLAARPFCFARGDVVFTHRSAGRRVMPVMKLAAQLEPADVQVMYKFFSRSGEVFVRTSGCFTGQLSPGPQEVRVYAAAAGRTPAKPPSASNSADRGLPGYPLGEHRLHVLVREGRDA